MQGALCSCGCSKRIVATAPRPLAAPPAKDAKPQFLIANPDKQCFPCASPNPLHCTLDLLLQPLRKDLLSRVCHRDAWVRPGTLRSGRDRSTGRTLPADHGAKLHMSVQDRSEYRDGYRDPDTAKFAQENAPIRTDLLKERTTNSGMALVSAILTKI